VSPVVVAQSPEQLLSGESSNFTGRSSQSNQFQFSPAQKSSQTLTPSTDPSSTSSRNGTPNTGLSHFASTASISPVLPRSYTPGSGPSTSAFAASPGLVNALNTPGTGASSSSSGKFSHPPRPSALASLAASTAGLPRSRSESTPFVEMSGRTEPKRLSKSRWASDSDLRSSAYFITEEPTTGRVEEDSSNALVVPRMPAAMEEQARASSPALSTKSSFLELPLNSPAPSRTFPPAPRPTPASSFKTEYAPSTLSNGSGGSNSSGPSPPSLQHSQSTPMLPTAASIAAKANLPPSINLPLPDDPPLAFSTTPVPFKTIPLAEARSLFSTAEVQQIISLAIQSASPSGSVHLLSVEAMSVLVPLEIRKLQARQLALITEFKSQSRRRKRIHGYLNEQRGGTSEGKAGRIASALTTITSKGDAACEEVSNQTLDATFSKTRRADSFFSCLVPAFHRYQSDRSAQIRPRRVRRWRSFARSRENQRVLPSLGGENRSSEVGEGSRSGRTRSSPSSAGLGTSQDLGSRGGEVETGEGTRGRKGGSSLRRTKNTASNLLPVLVGTASSLPRVGAWTHLLSRSRVASDVVSRFSFVDIGRPRGFIALERKHPRRRVVLPIPSSTTPGVSSTRFPQLPNLSSILSSLASSSFAFDSSIRHLPPSSRSGEPPLPQPIASPSHSSSRSPSPTGRPNSHSAQLPSGSSLSIRLHLDDTTNQVRTLPRILFHFDDGSRLSYPSFFNDNVCCRSFLPLLLNLHDEPSPNERL